MASGNGADLGTVVTMLSDVLVQVQRLAVKVDAIEARLQRVEARLDRLEARLDRLEAKVDQGFVEMRATVDFYHSAVVGHGIQISDLQDEVGQIKDHLGLPRGASQ